MKDTIGAHMAASFHALRQSIDWNRQGGRSSFAEEMSAAWEGRAYGHAFRAAELAHELGQTDALWPELRRVSRDLRATLSDIAEHAPAQIMNQARADMMGVSVHWDGEEFGEEAER